MTRLSFLSLIFAFFFASIEGSEPGLSFMQKDDSPNDTPNVSFNDNGADTPNMSISETELTAQEICNSIRNVIEKNPRSINTPMDSGKTYIYSFIEEALYVATDADFTIYKTLIEFLIQKGANLNIGNSNVLALLNKALADQKNKSANTRAGTLRKILPNEGQKKYQGEGSTQRTDIRLEHQQAESEIARKKAELEATRLQAELNLAQQKAELEAKELRAQIQHSSQQRALDEQRRELERAKESAERERNNARASSSATFPSVLFLGTCAVGIGVIFALAYNFPKLQSLLGVNK